MGSKSTKTLQRERGGAGPGEAYPPSFVLYLNRHDPSSAPPEKKKHSTPPPLAVRHAKPTFATRQKNANASWIHPPSPAKPNIMLCRPTPSSLNVYSVHAYASCHRPAHLLYYGKQTKTVPRRTSWEAPQPQHHHPSGPTPCVHVYKYFFE